MEPPPVIFDIGSAWCKAGLAVKNYPSLVVPTFVGHQPYDTDPETGASKIRKVIGSENMHVIKHLPVIDFPVDRGRVTNWDAMEAIWQYTFDCIEVDIKSHPVVVTELPHSDKNHQQKILEVMMETFDVPSLHIGNQAELSLFGSGLLTGTVVNCGAGVTYVAPIIGGQMIPASTVVWERGGLDVSSLLYRYLFYSEMRLNNVIQRESMEELKEKLCYVNESPDQEKLHDVTGNQGRVSILPDGRVVTLTKKHCTCPDLLFNPSQFNLPGVNLNLGFAVLKSTMASCKSGNVFSHVVLSGGSTLFPGFPERLYWELNAMKPLMYPTKIVSLSNRLYLPWMGGAILSCLSTFNSRCITREKYYEERTVAFS